MTGLAEAVHGAVGQPASIRVGVVDSLDPLIITAQGVPFEDVGLLNSFPAQAGNPVILVGQSSEAGSDPASWVALGSATGRGLRVEQARATSTHNLVVAETILDGTLIGMTTTAPTTLIEAFWTVDFEVIGATITTAVVKPSLDGVPQTGVQAIFEMPVAAAAGRFTIGNHTLFTVGPGDHWMELSGNAGVANMIRAVAGSTNLMTRVYG